MQTLGEAIMKYPAHLTTADARLLWATLRINDLEAEVAHYKRVAGKARLLADLRAQAAEFEISADSVPALLRPQA